MFFASLLVFAFTTTAGAQTGSKNSRLDYNDFKITVDGQQVDLSANLEPFAINNVTYIPLRVVGEALKCGVKWEAETKTVAITSSASTQVSTLLQQLAQKEGEIDELKRQVAWLQEELKDEDEDEDEDFDLSDLEDDLLDDYDEIEDVEVDDIRLDGDDDDVYVEVEVDLDDYEDEWADLSDREIDDWVEELVEEIQDELSDDTDVDGEIINNDNGDVLVDFAKDGDDDLEVDIDDEDYRGGDVDEVEDNLDGDDYDVDSIEFEITSISYDERDDEIAVVLRAQENDAAGLWDDLDSDDIEDYVEYICEDIADAFIDDANAEPEIIKIYLYDENSDLLDSYEYDVEDGS